MLMKVIALITNFKLSQCNISVVVLFILCFVLFEPYARFHIFS